MHNRKAEIQDKEDYLQYLAENIKQLTAEEFILKKSIKDLRNEKGTIDSFLDEISYWKDRFIEIKMELQAKGMDIPSLESESSLPDNIKNKKKLLQYLKQEISLNREKLEKLQIENERYDSEIEDAEKILENLKNQIQAAEEKIKGLPISAAENNS